MIPLLVHVVIVILIAAVLLWAVRALTPALGLPPIVTTVVTVLVVLVLVVWLLQLLAGGTLHVLP